MLCIFLLPAVLLVALLIFLPVILNVYYSMFKWTAYSKSMEFVGLKYFQKLFADEKVWHALLNNAKYAVISIVFQVGLALIIAHLLNNFANRRFASMTRVIIYWFCKSGAGKDWTGCNCT